MNRALQNYQGKSTLEILTDDVAFAVQTVDTGAGSGHGNLAARALPTRRTQAAVCAENRGIQI